MQRRVAAIYFVFFLVLGAGAYSVIALAEKPAVDVDGNSYGSGETFTLNGQQYTVRNLSTSQSEGDGHGGGGGVQYTGQITWTNTSFTFTEALQNNSTVNRSNQTFRVLIPNESNTNQFTLREQQNVSQILANDSEVENQTVTRSDGNRYVVYNNGTTQPLEEYLPAPETQTYRQGDTFPYKGNETTVTNVTTAQATIEWTGTNNNTVELSQASNVSLGGETYLAYFQEDGKRVTLSKDFKAYQESLARQANFQERMSGLWGVVIISGLAGILIVALSYLPVRG